MVERRHLGADADPFRRPAGEAKPSANILSSMGIVMHKIQREERPRCKILPEAVRQAPSLFPHQSEAPRNPLSAAGLKEEEAKREKEPGTP